MKKLCLFLFAMLLTVYGFGQAEKGVVYLKNGTILKGRYQYFDDFNKLRVESAGNIWVFPAGEVDTVTSRSAARIREIHEQPDGRALYFRTELGVLAGNSENSQSAPLSFSGTLNYSITSNFSAGAGVGVEFLKESYLPAFLNLEYKFRNESSAPYLFIKGGYQVPLEESREVYNNVWPATSSIWPGPAPDYEKLDPRGGVLVNPGIGYSHLFSPGFGMSFAFGYQFHRLQYDGEKDYQLNIDYNRLTVKLGFIFN